MVALIFRTTLRWIWHLHPPSGRLIAFVKNNQGLSYAENKMMQFQAEALSLLANYPDSDFKAALVLMVNYVIERKK